MLKWRVLVADDHALMAEGICRILETEGGTQTEFEVVGVAPDGRQLVESARELGPDVICLDIGMPGLNGIQAAVELRRVAPRAKLIFVTQQVELPYLRAAFHAGASGYVAKQTAGSELRLAIRRVMAGKVYVTPLLPEAVLENPENLHSDPAKVFTDILTTRQREVLQLVAEGRTVKQISQHLNISGKTVEFHKSCLMDELGMRTTAELTRYAITHNIVSAEAGPLRTARAFPL